MVQYLHLRILKCSLVQASCLKLLSQSVKPVVRQNDFQHEIFVEFDHTRKYVSNSLWFPELDEDRTFTQFHGCLFCQLSTVQGCEFAPDTTQRFIDSWRHNTSLAIFIIQNVMYFHRAILHNVFSCILLTHIRPP